MADKTQNDLINEAASLLGKLVPGEALGAPEYETIKGCVEPAVSETNRIVAIDSEEIDPTYFNTLARIVAVHAAAKFANAPLDMPTIEALENRMRVLAFPDTVYQPAVYEYF